MRQFSRSMSIGFILKFLVEIQAAKQVVHDMGNETSLLLTTDKQHARRRKPALPVAALALAVLGVFGSGILMRNRCNVITGIVGSC